MEECVLIEQDALNEIIIPTTNIDRQLPDGTMDRKEVVNKSQVYITTAGWKNSFAYAKLIELLIRSILEPDEVMVMGGTWVTPVTEGLLAEDFVEELKLSGTYNEDSFDREYGSKWSGDVDNAFFSSEKFDKCRIISQPEYEYVTRGNKNAYYILGVDIGRFKCTTEVCIIKVSPQIQGAAIKTLVNAFSYQAEDFEEQAIKVKKLFYKYKAKQVVIDANGVGAGFVDFMTKQQIDKETGDELMPFGVSGGTFEEVMEQYKKIRGIGVEENAMFLIKANAPINTEAHAYVQTQMYSGKLKFLIDESQAKAKLMSTKVGQDMDVNKRAEYLRPYILTTSLREQMLNLTAENEGINIILKQSSKKIPKDRFSAFEYGLYYIKQEEDNKRKRKNRDLSKLALFSSNFGQL